MRETIKTNKKRDSKRAVEEGLGLRRGRKGIEDINAYVS